MTDAETARSPYMMEIEIEMAEVADITWRKSVTAMALDFALAMIRPGSTMAGRVASHSRAQMVWIETPCRESLNLRA